MAPAARSQFSRTSINCNSESVARNSCQSTSSARGVDFRAQASPYPSGGSSVISRWRGSADMVTVRILIDNASQSSRRPLNGSPIPVSSLIASVA